MKSPTCSESILKMWLWRGYDDDYVCCSCQGARGSFGPAGGKGDAVCEHWLLKIFINPLQFDLLLSACIAGKDLSMYQFLISTALSFFTNHPSPTVSYCTLFHTIVWLSCGWMTPLQKQGRYLNICLHFLSGTWWCNWLERRDWS